MVCGLLVATPQILPPPRGVRTADTASFMEKPFIEVGLLAAPGKHRFKFGEVVTLAVGVDFGGEQGDALVDKRVGGLGVRPRHRAFDAGFVASGVGGEPLEKFVLATKF